MNMNHQHRQDTIIDLGPLGPKLYNNIMLYLDNTITNDRDLREIAKKIYNTIIDDIVQLLNKPIEEAMNRVNTLSEFTFHFDLDALFRLLDRGELVDAIQPLVFDLYNKISYQLTNKEFMNYSSKWVGLDYVVVRETPKTQEQMLSLDEYADRLAEVYNGQKYDD